MPKENLLDRLAGAMKTLNKRQAKNLTPRQRVAAAQRWNSLAVIGMDESDERYNRFIDVNKGYIEGTRDEENALRKEAEDAYNTMRGLGISSTTYPFESGRSEYADNPFLSDNIDKYKEQSDFLDWCRHYGVEPNGETLKQFRWETYKTLPQRERQWIANKDAVRNYMRDNYTLYGQQPPELKTLRDVDEYWTRNVWNGVEPREGYLEYAYPKRQPYSSIEEFPDDFDYMWRY